MCLGGHSLTYEDEHGHGRRWQAQDRLKDKEQRHRSLFSASACYDYYYWNCSAVSAGKRRRTLTMAERFRVQRLELFSRPFEM
jgi:hypothetical protein